MRKIVSVIGVSAALGIVAVRAWRRNPRFGVVFVNAVVNPALIRRGLAGGRSELGTIEHVGRMTGIRRLTPIHPEPMSDGFRVLVPLGMKSEWARNVLAAGHCRLHLHDQVFDLDEPALMPAGQAADLPWPIRRLMTSLGFEYLTLHTFARSVDETESEPVPVAEPAAAETVPAG